MPGTLSDVPIWIVQTIGEICRGHDGMYNDRFLGLIEHVTKPSRL